METATKNTFVNITSYLTSFPGHMAVIGKSENASYYGHIYDYENFDPRLFLSHIDLDLYLDMSPVNILLIVLYSAIFLLGLFGNVFVIVAIVKFKSLRTLTNYFLLNLTIGDILVILVCIPVTLGSNLYKKWVYGEFLCKLTPFIQGSAVGVSVLSLLSISISRYFAIYKPLSAKIIFSKRNVRIMLVIIWVISFASLSPLLFVNSVKTYVVYDYFESQFCEEVWTEHKDKNIYNIFIFCILFVWPFILMTIAYAVIGHTLWIGNSVLMEDYSCQQKRSNLILKQRRRTVKMLVCVVILFALCWLPYYIVNFWLDFNILDDSKVELMTFVHSYIYPFVTALGLGNSAVNPICYCFMSRGFRRGFDEMLCNGLLKRGGSFLRSSFKLKSTVSESFDTANL